MWSDIVPSSRTGLDTTKGSSCSGSMYLWPALRTLICGRHTTRVAGMEAWLWYQLRTVPGMSPQMMVLGEGRLSLGRNMQHDCSSNWRGERETKGHKKSWIAMEKKLRNSMYSMCVLWKIRNRAITKSLSYLRQ